MAGLVALASAGEHGGAQNGVCYAHGCSSTVDGSAEMPDSFDDMAEMLKGAGYCSHHKEVIAKDMRSVSLAHTANKIEYFVRSFKPSQLLCVRHFDRPHLFASRAVSLFRSMQQIEHSQRPRYKALLHLLTFEDPSLDGYLPEYLKHPDRFLFVPAGSHFAASHIMASATRILEFLRNRRYRSITFMDDNLQSVGGLYSKSGLACQRPGSMNSLMREIRPCGSYLCMVGVHVAD